MARKTFFSFHFENDNWRAGQVRNMGLVEGNSPVSDNDWEEVKKGGDSAIEKWIADQMKGKSCTILLVGKKTAGRKWIEHEIKKSWTDGKGLVGIYIHNLKDSFGNQSSKGSNPFSGFKLNGTHLLSNIVKCYDPPYSTSSSVYDYIKENLADWAEEAIEIREKY